MAAAAPSANTIDCLDPEVCSPISTVAVRFVGCMKGHGVIAKTQIPAGTVVANTNMLPVITDANLHPISRYLNDAIFLPQELVNIGTREWKTAYESYLSRAAETNNCVERDSQFITTKNIEKDEELTYTYGAEWFVQCMYEKRFEQLRLGSMMFLLFMSKHQPLQADAKKAMDQYKLTEEVLASAIFSRTASTTTGKQGARQGSVTI